MSDFNTWYDNEPMPKDEKDVVAKSLYFLNKSIARRTWNHQQQTIDKQNELIEKLARVTEFYGDKDNWEPNSLYKKTNSYMDAFVVNDEENVATGKYVGGKKAREILNSEEFKQWRGEDE